MVPTRAPVSTAVYDALRADVLGGRLVTGDAIPSERTLSEHFAVNRHAVREAVKRLQQAGLVQVAHGGATRVRDWRATGGLELLADLPASGDPDAVRAGYELRACLAAEVAARAADRAPRDHRSDLRARSDALSAARDGGDERAVLDAYRRLWDVLVDAADNVAYRLAYNSLLASEDAAGDVTRPLLRAELHDAAGVETLVAAALDGDGGAARDAATTLCAHTLAALSPEAARAR